MIYEENKVEVSSGVAPATLIRQLTLCDITWTVVIIDLARQLNDNDNKGQREFIDWIVVIKKLTPMTICDKHECFAYDFWEKSVNLIIKVIDCRLGRFYLQQDWHVEYIHTWQQLIREKEIKQMMGKLAGDLVDAMPGKGDKKNI